MALRGGFGVMGSGKSHEGVAEHIVPAIRAGRRVVTSIEGLNHSAFFDFYTDKKKSKKLGHYWPEADPEAIKNNLVVVTNEQLKDDAAWYDPDENPNAIIQPGDLIICDEAHEVFGKDKQISERKKKFIAMHRHYKHPVTQETCDMLLLTQSERGLHEFVRERMELRYVFRKQKALGKPDQYRVYLFEPGARKASDEKGLSRSYIPEIFPLYQSYTGGGSGKESSDKRQNIFGRAMFKVWLPLFGIASIFAIWYVFHFFSHMGQNKLMKNQKVAAADAKTATPGQPTAAPGPNQNATHPTTPAASNAEDWRVVASFNVGRLKVFTLVNSKGQYRKLTAGSWAQGASDDIQVKVPNTEPGMATPYTGPAPEQTASHVKSPEPAPTK